MNNNSNFTKEQLIERINEVLPCLRECITPDNELQKVKMTVAIYEIALASLGAEQEKEPELKPAELINKFYERYPVASFKSDSERAAALGYLIAGAELQCFGEFVKYEDLCGDE